MTVLQSCTPASNPWQAATVRIAGIDEEIPGVATYHLEFVDLAVGRSYQCQPGQFNMLYLPGIGESAISVSGPASAQGRWPHTVRVAGNVTGALSKLGRDGQLGLRGPFGSGWPMEECAGRDVVLVAGGIGLAPVRPVIEAILAQPQLHGQLTLLCGARSPEQLLYPSQYDSWRRAGARVETTVDRAMTSWRGNVGVVPLLIDRLSLPNPAGTVFFVCGPDVMMWYAVKSARQLGVPPENIWLNMERNMNCAVGLCGHCQYGPAFICKDGPVLRYDRMSPFLTVKDL